MNINISIIPPNRGEEAIPQIKAMVEDRSKIIAKRFNMDVLDVDVKLYQSAGALKANLGANIEGLGIFAGYVDNTKTLSIIHPDAVKPVFGKNLDKELGILVDYCLSKFYLCQKYYPNDQGYKLYYKHVSESLAAISSGKLKKNMLKMEFKNYDSTKRYKKDIELNLVFFTLMEMGGIDSIYAHLDNIMKDCDIKKTLNNDFKKSIDEIIKPYKAEAEAEHKALLNRFKPGRRR